MIPLGAWDTFAAIAGSSAAALAGLLFVAVTLHAREIANSERRRPGRSMD